MPRFASVGERPLSREYVYVIGIVGQPLVKVGMTASPELRLHGAIPGASRYVNKAIFYTRRTYHARWVESVAHRLLRRFRAQGEWFRCEPWYAALVVTRAFEFVCRELAADKQLEREELADLISDWRRAERRVLSLRAHVVEKMRRVGGEKPRIRVPAVMRAPA